MRLKKINYHIHTEYCAHGSGRHEMTIERIVRESEKLGYDSIGITEHLSTRELMPAFPRIKQDIAAVNTDLEVYFGAEVVELGATYDTVLTAPLKICITAADRDQLGFDFIIGACHSLIIDRGHFTTQKFVDIQHWFHCFLLQHPLVDVLGHPWAFPRKGFDAWDFPWFDDMSIIPEAYHLELARMAAANGTAVEVNAKGIFFNPDYSDKVKDQYKDYIRLLVDNGVRISVGSDAHGVEGLPLPLVVMEILEEIGITPDQLWSPAQAQYNLARKPATQDTASE